MRSRLKSAERQQVTEFGGPTHHGSLGRGREMWVASYSMVAAVILVILSYWGPWIDHQTAALKLSGQDLGEFVKFLPDIRRGQMRFPRQVFYLPPFVTAVCLVLLAANRALPYPRWLRAAMLVLALFLLPGLLPPVWGHPRELFAREFRLQGVAAVLGLLLIVAHGLFRGLSRTGLSLCLSGLALVGLIPVQWAFWSIRSRIWAAYDTPTIRLGWGLWLNIAAWLGLLAAAALLFHSFRKE